MLTTLRPVTRQKYDAKHDKAKLPALWNPGSRKRKKGSGRVPATASKVTPPHYLQPSRGPTSCFSQFAIMSSEYDLISGLTHCEVGALMTQSLPKVHQPPSIQQRETGERVNFYQICNNSVEMTGIFHFRKL